jgi:hypothetical protein
MSYAKPSVFHAAAHIGTLGLAVAATSVARAQCPPPPNPACPPALCGTYTCTGSGLCGAPTPRRCDVYCQQQLLDVLEDEVETGLCRHIRIPAGVCVDICNQISIGDTHLGTLQCPLLIEILGTIRYVGEPSEGARIFKGDIAPPMCGDNVVNIDDLLFVISWWGGCPATNACGDEPAQPPGGPPEAPPETIDDCWDKATEAHPEGGVKWAEAFEACLEALDQLGGGN